MKKKVLLITIPIVLVIAIVAAVIIGLVLNKDSEEDESVGSKWGDTYYAYLKEAIKEKDLTVAEEKYGMMLDMKDAKLQFCEVEENQNPTMIMTYKKNESSYINVYQLTDEKKVNYIAYKQPTELEYLYDISKDEYSWYIHTTENENESYSSLKSISNNLKENSTKSDSSENVNIAELQADYTIKKEEAEVTTETTDGNTLSYKKFDEIFVKPNIEQNKQIDFNVNIKEKDLKQSMKDAVGNYEKDSNKLTDEIKQEVSKKVEETKKKIEDVNKAKEEVAKKKAEEEEAKKGLVVGKYTLKYGTYTSDIHESGLYGTITLNYGGTFHIKSNYEESSAIKNGGIDEDGKYEVKLNQSDGYGGTTNYIEFKTNSGYTFSFEVSNNDSLTDQYHGYYYGTTKKTYPGTSTNSTNSSSSSETSSNTNTSSNKDGLTPYEYDTAANNSVAEGTYYRDKGTGVESVLKITNTTGSSFDFTINAIYMTQAGYPNFGEVTGTAKAIKGGGYVFHTTEGTLEYNIFFKISGNESNPTIDINDECYNTKKRQKEFIMPYCGHNVTFVGTYNK
ncbi:MAG: hypothetical protein J6J36_06285 [Clostridia bacterium]|nr:hypothetical protein [Clostridia bacterium]